MSDALDDRLRATRLLLEAGLAARGVARLDVDDERLRELIATGGPELRLIVALLSTLDIPPDLLPPAAGAEPSRDADGSLAANLLRTEAALPPVPPLAPGDLDRLLPRLESAVESLVEGLRRGAGDEAP